MPRGSNLGSRRKRKSSATVRPAKPKVATKKGNAMLRAARTGGNKKRMKRRVMPKAQPMPSPNMADPMGVGGSGALEG